MVTKSQVLARRAGRTVFGSVLILGTIWLFYAGCSGRHDWQRERYAAGPFDAAQIIGLTWLAAVVAGVAAWRLVRWRPLTGGRGRLLYASVMIPAAGFAVLLPISLHCLVALAISERQAFGDWVIWSILYSGLAHLALLLACLGRSYQLVAGKPAWSPATIYFVVVAVSCVPFIILILPPLIVAATGIGFLPVLYAMQWTTEREHADMASLPADLPRAVARIEPA